MKQAFNKNAGGKELVEFVSKTIDNQPHWQDAFETLAIGLLPLIREMRQSGDLDTKIANIPAAYAFLTEDIDFSSAAETLRGIEVADIRGFIDKSVAADPTPAETLKKAGQLKERIMGLPEDEYIALSRAIESLLPPSLEAAVAAARGGKSLEEEAKENRALAASLSAAEIAEQMMLRRAGQDKDEIAKGIHALFQQCTPQRLEAFARYADDNLGGPALALLVKRFWDFAEETLAAADAGNFMQPKSPGKVKAFGRALRDTLTVIDEGLAEAGFTLPPGLSSAVANAVDTGALLRDAQAAKHAARLQSGTTDDLTVSKPLQIKKRGFSL